MATASRKYTAGAGKPGGALHNTKPVMDLMSVRVGFEGKPDSIRKIKRTKLKPGFLNKIFDTDVEYLQVT